MVKMRYLGLENPHAACLAMQPYREYLVSLSTRFKPFGPEHAALHKATSAIDEAIGALCGDPTLLHHGPGKRRP